jgi:hypothetical protein
LVAKAMANNNIIIDAKGHALPKLFLEKLASL